MTTPVLARGQTTLRTATLSDADGCGRIFYDAFAAIAGEHSFPVEPSSPQFTAWKVADMLQNPGFYGAVAERNSQIVGSIFMDERSTIVGLGPVTVDPGEQDQGIGRLLMRHALARSVERDVPGVRLVQTAYHYRSFALYASLGFQVREPLSVLQGQLRPDASPPSTTRQAMPPDLDACSQLCTRVHGHDRRLELAEAIGAGTAKVVESDGSITGYATGFGYGWHAVARTNVDLIALLRSAELLAGLGILVPSRNSDLLQWGLANGLRVVQQSTLMTLGLHSEPVGAYLPSILF